MTPKTASRGGRGPQDVGAKRRFANTPSASEFEDGAAAALSMMAKGKFTLKDSISAALKECIKNNVLREYLLNHGQGVAGMLFAQFTQEDVVNSARKEGLEKGREKGREAVAKNLLSSDLSLDFVAKYTELDVARLEALKAEIAD